MKKNSSNTYKSAVWQSSIYINGLCLNLGEFILSNICPEYIRWLLNGIESFFLILYNKQESVFFLLSILYIVELTFLLKTNILNLYIYVIL